MEKICKTHLFDQAGNIRPYLVIYLFVSSSSLPAIEHIGGDLAHSLVAWLSWYGSSRLVFQCATAVTEKQYTKTPIVCVLSRFGRQLLVAPQWCSL